MNKLDRCKSKITTTHNCNWMRNGVIRNPLFKKGYPSHINECHKYIIFRLKTKAALNMDNIVTLIEDAELFMFINYILERNGYKSRISTAIDDVSRKISCGECDAIIICLMKIDSSREKDLNALVAELNAKNIPALALLDNKNSDNHTALLNAGITDYLTRPFSPNYLVNYINMLNDKPNDNQADLPCDVRSQVRVNDILIDMNQRAAFVGGEDLSIGGVELNILLCLARRPAKVFSRGEIIDIAWPRGIFVDERTVDVHIGRLRRRLGAKTKNTLIKTVHLEGYALINSANEATGVQSEAVNR